MPSPVGHAMAGMIVAVAAHDGWRVPRPAPAVPRSLLFACMALATLPDADLLYVPIHRGPTHSLTAAAIVTMVAAAVTAWTGGRVNWRVALACGVAYGSHVIVDWMGQDWSLNPGLQVFWPFSDHYYMSGWDLFRRTERHAPLSMTAMTHNAVTLALELAIFGPVLALVWWRRRRLSRG